MEKKIPVEINGRIHHLSERAIQILNLKSRIVPKEKPIELLKMPPKLDIIKAEKIKLKTEPEVKPKHAGGRPKRTEDAGK